MPLIDRLARRRFGETALAEEGAMYVLEHLQADDCRRLHSFTGRSKFSTYLRAVVLRLLEDFSRRRFGRIRPPSWIADLGGIWLVMFELLCLQRLNVGDAVQTALGMKRAGREQDIEKTAWTILERIVDCGRHQGLEVDFDENEPLREQEERDGNPEKQLLEDERKMFYELLFGSARVQIDNSLARKIGASVRLSDEDRLLLKLCFQEELPVTRAGELLGLGANQVHGRLRRLLARIRSGLEQAGISEELRDMLHG